MADNNAEHMMMQQGMEQMETDQSDIVSQALRSAQPDQMQMMQEEQQQQMEDDQVVTTSLQFDPSNPNVLYTSDGQLINRSDLSPEEQLLVQQALQQHLAEQEAQDQLQGIDEQTAAASNGENVENIAGGASGEQINKPADLVQTISDNVRRQQEYVKAQNLLMQASESNKPAELPQGYRYEEKIVIRQGQPHVMKMPVKKARGKGLDLPPALQSLMPKVDVGKDGHSVIRIHQSQISPEQLKSLQENPNVRLVFRPPGGKRGGRGGPNRRRGRPKSKPYNVSDRGGPDSPSYNDYPGSRGRRGRGRGSYVGGGYRKTGTEASRMDWLRAQDTYDAEAEATQQRLSYVPPKLSNLSQEEQQISQRRRNRLKEVLNECSPEDVLQATLPHLSRVFSVYEFLVMKVEGDKDQVGRVYFGDVYKEYESLHKYMSNLTPKYFDALRDKRVQKQKEEEQKALKEAQEQEEKEREAQEKLEKEAHEKAEKEAQEKAEKEAQEKALKEAQEKAEKEKAEQEAKEKAEKEAKEAGEKEKVEVEVQEKQQAEEVQKPASEAADKVEDKKDAATEETKAGSEVVMAGATPQEKVDENKTKEADTIEVTMTEVEKPTEAKEEKPEKSAEEAEVQVKKEEQSSGVPAEKRESEDAKPEEKVEGDKVEAMEVTEESKETTEETKTPEDKSKDSEVTEEAKVSEEGKTPEDKPKEPEAVASTEEKEAEKESAEQKQAEEAEQKADKPAEEKEIKIEEGQESVEKVSEEKSEEESGEKKEDDKSEDKKEEDKKEEDEFYHIKSHLLARSLGLEGDVLEDAMIVLNEGGDDQNNNLQDNNKMNAVSDSGLDTNQLQTQMEGVVSQQQQQIDNSQVTFVTGNQQISSLGESVVTSSQMDSSIVTSQQQVVEQMQVDPNQLQVEQQQQVHQKVEEQQQMQTSEVVQQQQEVDQMGQTIQLDQGQSQIIPASTDGAQIIQIGTGEDRQFIEVPEGYTLIQTANGLVMSQPGTTITQGDDGTIYVTNEDGTTVPLTDANQGNPQQ